MVFTGQKDATNSIKVLKETGELCQTANEVKAITVCLNFV